MSIFSRKKKTPSPLNVLNEIKITNPYYAQTQVIRTSLKKKLQNGTIKWKEAQKIIQDHLNFVKNQQTTTQKSRQQTPKNTVKSKSKSKSKTLDSPESLFDGDSPLGYLQPQLKNVNIGIYTHGGKNVPIHFLEVPNNATLSPEQIQQKINQYNTFNRIVPFLNTSRTNNKRVLYNAGIFLKDETVKNIKNTDNELIQLTFARNQLLQTIHKKLTNLEDRMKNLKDRMAKGTRNKKKKRFTSKKRKKTTIKKNRKIRRKKTIKRRIKV